MGQLLDTDEQEQLARFGGHLGQGAFELGDGLGALGARFGGSGSVRTRLEVQGAHAVSVEQEEAAVAAKLVAGDGEQPGGEVGVFGEAEGVAGELEEGLLEQIVGEVAAAGEAEEEAMDAITVLGVGAIEGGGIAAAQSRDQLALGIAIHRGEVALPDAVHFADLAHCASINARGDIS